MTTTNTPRKIQACASMEELAELTAKVRMSKTYHGAWFVYSTKPSNAKTKLQTTMYQVRASFYDKETALDMAARGQAMACSHDPKGGKQLTFKIGNLYDNYWIYKEGSEHRHPRAQQWEDIKEATKRRVETMKAEDIRRWEQAAAEG